MNFFFKTVSLPSSTYLEKPKTESSIAFALRVGDHCFSLGVCVLFFHINPRISSKKETCTHNILNSKALAIQLSHKNRLSIRPYLPQEYLDFFNVEERSQNRIELAQLKPEEANSLILFHFEDGSFHSLTLVNSTRGFGWFDSNYKTLDIEPKRFEEIVNIAIDSRIYYVEKFGPITAVERIWYEPK